MVFVEKWSLSLAFNAGGGFEPEEYMEYFEDLSPLSNEKIE